MSRYRLIVWVFAILLLAGFVGSRLYLATNNQPSENMLEVKIEGLQNVDKAELVLIPELLDSNGTISTEEIALSPSRVGNGIHKIRIAAADNGTYKLIIQAKPEYFFDPKGYLIRIENNRSVYRADKAIRFNLISPSDQDLPPCRGNTADTRLNNPEVCRAEAIVDLISPPKKPILQQPMVKGQYTGIADNTVITFHIKTPTGTDAAWGTRQGDGEWQATVGGGISKDYIVTAEASGYISIPISYNIRLSELVAYVVEDDRITTKEADHLDFRFERITTSTPGP